MAKDKYEVIIVGAGPAGMAAALIAGRARLKTALLSDGTARNLVTTASHGFLTRDGAHPSELAAVAREQLKKYPSVEPRTVTVSKINRGDEGFVVEFEGGQLLGERVVLATGYRDELSRLNMPGIEEVYGKTVYPCPFCDGFEHADEKLAVFMGEGASHFAPVVRVWSKDIVVFSNGHQFDEDTRATLRANEVDFHEGRVARLHSVDGKLTAVELEDGTRVEREAGFIGDDFSVEANSFATDLGVGRTSNAWGMEVLEASESGRTNVEGLFVIGDAKSGFGGITAAVAEGAFAASDIVHEVAMQRWRSPQKP